MAFKPIFNNFDHKPISQYWSNPSGSRFVVIRDQFMISTWLMLGAFVQGLLCLLPFRNIALVAPVAMILAFQIIKTALINYGYLKNPNMEGVVPGRTVPIFPDENGTRDRTADRQLCVILLGARSNHPLGIFNDGFKVVGQYFAAMLKELEEKSTENGFLGASKYISATDRGSASELMNILYFDSLESLHAFAHGPLHTEAMEWWAKESRNLGHISLSHEAFAVPKNSWEGVYLNYHPSGLGATRKEVAVDGKKVWMNPLVQGKGRLTYSKGRMDRPFNSEKEWVAYENTLTTDEKAGSY